MENSDKFLSQFLFYCQNSQRRSFYALASLFFLCLLAYNSFSIFCTHLPFPVKIPPAPEGFLPTPSSEKLPSAVKNEILIARLNTHLPLMHKNPNLLVYAKRNTPRRKRHRRTVKIPGPEDISKRFEARVVEFFNPNSSYYSCEFRFFMTWISSLESFGGRELFSLESLFKTHPYGCLIIASYSLDSRNGMKILKPFLDKGFKVAAISPDFTYLFKNTAAQSWYNHLIQGKIKTGEISFGQNLSNLLRLGLLYRFGGIYIDTDIIVLRSFGEMRNVIGAQTLDSETGNWSRLNNAVMVFDKGHPLLYKFIQEFALTFDGNKWGHNGPYLVSRVVSRLSGRTMYNFTVVPPMVFYPVDWSRIGAFFQGPKSLSHSKWLLAKLRQIRSHSFTVHLWNKHSRGFGVEKGSIIQHLMKSSCVFCNSSSSALL